VITAMFAAGIVAYTLLQASGSGRMLMLLQFYSSNFLRGQIWQAITYPWLEAPSFFSLIGLACFYVWALEVEKYLGRIRFLALFASLLFVPVAAASIFHAAGYAWGFSGNYEITAGVLIAFATLYPNLDYFFGWIPLKWFAFACVVLGCLTLLPQQNWLDLFHLLSSCAIAFGYVRWLQLGAEFRFPKVRLPFSFSRKKPNLRVLPSPIPAAEQADEDNEPMTEVDELLDKIAQSGIASLTSKERAKLEKARETLMKRESTRR
jgi:hypothetical protein